MKLIFQGSKLQQQISIRFWSNFLALNFLFTYNKKSNTTNFTSKIHRKKSKAIIKINKNDQKKI